MNVPIDATFKLEKDVTEKIRQFMSDYFQKSTEQKTEDSQLNQQNAKEEK